MTDDLIERALRGEASEAELAALVAWRRAAPENEQHYRRVERLIAAARTLRQDTPVRRPSAASIIGASTAAGTQPRVAGSGAAAGRRPHAGARRPRRSRLARAAPWAVAAAAALIAMLNLGDTGGPAAGPPTEVITGATELATVKLGDGTVVRLAPSSRLQFGGDGARGGFGAHDVTLDGRAFFVVAKQPAGRPFRVHTGAATANVLGTRFELATEDAGVRLRVVEGRVALDAPRNTVEVGAGEESGVRDGVAASPTPVQGTAAGEPGWLGKFLVFQATPLTEAAREIERLYGVRVAVADSSLAAATITATFTDRPVDDVVRVLCEVLSASCLVQDGTATIGR